MHMHGHATCLWLSSSYLVDLLYTTQLSASWKVQPLLQAGVLYYTLTKFHASKTAKASSLQLSATDGGGLSSWAPCPDYWPAGQGKAPSLLRLISHDIAYQPRAYKLINGLCTTSVHHVDHTVDEGRSVLHAAQCSREFTTR
jgi:hypothetical protein